MNNVQVRNSFYVRMGFILVALIFAGFMPVLKTRFDSGGTVNATLVTHGFLTLGWFVLFTYQASLISLGNIKRHMTIGKVSVVIAAAITITGVLMMQDSFDRGSNGGTPFSNEHFIILPFLDIALFVIFYGLAFINRFEADTHKHFMLLTGIMIMDPAVARIGMTLGFMPVGLLLHFGLLAAVFLYDRKTYGHVHMATKIGLVALGSRYGLIFLLGPTEVWANFVHKVFG
jgi:uncharacterized membrane protein YozB (DUF420 family)